MKKANFWQLQDVVRKERYIAPVQVILLLLFSIFVIFWQFPGIPSNISWDELEFAKLALSLGNSSYTVYSELATGHATMYFYLLLGSLKAFGVTIFALRLPAAILGIVAVLLLYFLLKKIIINSWYAFMGAFMLAGTRWFVTFGRFSFEATFLLCLELTSLLFFAYYDKKKRALWLVFSAIFAGLAIHSYYPGRIFFLVPLIMLFLMKRWRDAGVFIAVCAVVAAPLLLYLAGNPDIRVGQVSVFSQNSSVTGILGQIGDNIARVGNMFFSVGDMNGRHNFPGKPALNAVSFCLFFIGLILMIIHRKDKWNRLFLLYCGISLAPSLFTLPVENPNMLRTVTILPAVIFAICTTIERVFLFTSKRQKWVAVGITVIILGMSVLYDMRTYFQFQSRVSRNAFEITCSLEKSVTFKAKTLGEIPNECRVLENEF